MSNDIAIFMLIRLIMVKQKKGSMGHRVTDIEISGLPRELGFEILSTGGSKSKL